MTSCCEQCKLYWACEEKWYRGERHEEDICCPACELFYVCNPEKAAKEKKKKKSE